MQGQNCESGVYHYPSVAVKLNSYSSYTKPSGLRRYETLLIE